MVYTSCIDQIPQGGDGDGPQRSDGLKEVNFLLVLPRKDPGLGARLEVTRYFIEVDVHGGKLEGPLKVRLYPPSFGCAAMKPWCLRWRIRSVIVAWRI